MPLTPEVRRECGTRFDSLDTQRSSQPRAATMIPRDTSSMSLNIRSRAGERASPYIPSGDAEEERSSPAHQHDASAISFSTPDPLPQIRMLHDAARVFVGGLPYNLPKQELHSRLRNHLAQFATIEHLRLMKNKRNARCGFVQAKSANEASALISACNLSMFMGRQIRCEHARPFRILLISWRAAEETAGNHLSPLRLRRCRNRYIQVTTHSDALVDDPSALHDFLPPRSDDIFSGTGAFFPEGLKRGNIEGLKALLEAFGRLKFMKPFDPAVHTQARPIEADVTRDLQEELRSSRPTTSSIKSLANGVVVDMWTARWEHRNDAVAAIQALQYVPSLHVAWLYAHGRPSPGPGHPEQLPYCSQQGRGGGAASVREDERWVGPRTGPRNSIRREGERKNPVSLNDDDFPPLAKNPPEGQSLSREGSHSERQEGGPWSGRRSSGFIRSNAPSPSSTDGLHPLDTTTVPNTKAAPPHPGETSDINAIPLTPDLISAVGSSPMTSVYPATPIFPTTTGHTSTQGISLGKAPEDGRKACNAQIHQQHSIYPPVANVRMVTQISVLPIEKEARPPSLPPNAPAVIAEPPSSNGIYQQHNGNGPGSYSGYRRRGEYDIDGGPSATLDWRELFVGRLDPETWSEGRVRSNFEQYGVIREVRFIKPNYNAPYKRAFAFVKFDDFDGPQRAIAAQHLRVYDGHSIKVELWDSHPPLQRSQRAYRPSANSPRRDIIAELTAREVERLARIQLGGDESGHGASPAASTGSAPTEVGNISAETGSSASESLEIIMITSPVVPFSVTAVQRETQSEPDIITAASRPQCSNGDARSYPPSAPESTPPSTMSFYSHPQAWPYGMPPGPYGPYGYYGYYYPPPVPGQPAPEGSNSQPMYRRPYLPWFDPPPGVELPPPPVRPSGFLQRDTDGLLLPIYPPDRLGHWQYASPGVSSTQPRVGLPSWQGIPPPRMYPVPIAMLPPMVVTPEQQQQQQRGLSGGPHTSQIQQSQQHEQPNVSRRWFHAQAPSIAVYPPPSQQGGYSTAAYTPASTPIPPYPTNPYYPVQAPPYPSRQASYDFTDPAQLTIAGSHRP